MRIMGIDYGDSRIGIAVSDPFGWTAQGVETVKSKGNEEKAIDRIVQLIQQYNVERIVVGYPRNMNGTIGPRAEKTDEFIKILSTRTEADIIRWDERLTSVAANRVMHEIGTRTAKKKAIVDQIAACYILQGYLDSIKS